MVGMGYVVLSERRRFRQQKIHVHSPGAAFDGFSRRRAEKRDTTHSSQRHLSHCAETIYNVVNYHYYYSKEE